MSENKTKNKKPKRRRNRAVTIRMNEEEYQIMLNKINESGLSQQSYVISAIQKSCIISSKEIDEQIKTNESFDILIQQLRGLATNVNQLARIANGLGILPVVNELSNIEKEISGYRTESREIWQSIRSLMVQKAHVKP